MGSFQGPFDFESENCPMCMQSLFQTLIISSAQTGCPYCGATLDVDFSSVPFRLTLPINVNWHSDAPILHSGDHVQCLSGAFKYLEGQVTVVNQQSQWAMVSIEMFGRETLSMISTNQLQVQGC